MLNKLLFAFGTFATMVGPGLMASIDDLAKKEKIALWVLNAAGAAALAVVRPKKEGSDVESRKEGPG